MTRMVVLSLVFTFCLVAPSHALASKRVALVVGNATYTYASELFNPRNDAISVAAALRSIGFDEVRLLLDVDHSSFRNALKDFSPLAEKSETALIYFAGHGVEVEGQNYLIPVDASLARATDVEFEAVNMSSLRVAVSGASTLRLVILDACRNNPFKLTSNKSTRSVGRGLARVEPGANELVAFASREGTVASDGSGATNSPYAASLIKHLSQPGLDVRLLFGRVRDDVLHYTQQQQEPFIYGSLGGSEIYLNLAQSPASPPLLTSNDTDQVIASLNTELTNLRAELAQKEDDTVNATSDSGVADASAYVKPVAQPIALLHTTQTATAEMGTGSDPRKDTVAIVDLTADRKTAFAIQTELGRLSCFRVVPDGNWGPASQEALDSLIARRLKIKINGTGQEFGIVPVALLSTLREALSPACSVPDRIEPGANDGESIESSTRENKTGLTSGRRKKIISTKSKEPRPEPKIKKKSASNRKNTSANTKKKTNLPSSDSSTSGSNVSIGGNFGGISIGSQ